ncbi:F-box domain-containing protein [Mycena venus]|uniref:F-box domain-containing protein n=1 Tax=Mycena venus TaxID=2733690 RepID=A0A8H7DDV9_9AGAR|nr:F-box domain-containing protein [Mycena venus]
MIIILPLFSVQVFHYLPSLLPVLSPVFRASKSAQQLLAQKSFACLRSSIDSMPRLGSIELFTIERPSIRDRLRDNILPLDTERLAIRDSIAVARSRLAELEASGLHFPRKDPHYHGPAALRQYISDYSSLLAPIRLLAVEILQAIFVHPDLHGFERMGPRIITMYRRHVIGKVSHHWREVARGTPELWSSFQVKLFVYKPYPDLEGLRLRLDRSKGVPLSISFDLMPPKQVDEPERPGYTARVAETVAPFLCHAERWAHVALPLDSVSISVFAPVQDRLLRLETLAFIGAADRLSREVRIFANAPKLRFLYPGRNMNPPRNLPPLPWHQLHQVYIHWMVTAEFVAVTPKLRDIIIMGGPTFDDRQFSPTLSPPSSSPTIQKIILHGESDKSRAATKVLNHINAPQLKELFLVQCAGWDPPSIPALIQRSGCSLETLVLQGGFLRPVDLLALLSEIPTLSTLVLIDNIPNTVTNRVLDELTLTALLPGLRTFVMKAIHLFTTDTLLTMLERRMALGSPSPLINIDITLLDRDVAASNLTRFSALPGVVSTHAPPVWHIFAGSRRDWRYTDHSEL